LRIQSILFISHTAIAAMAIVVLVATKTWGTNWAAGFAIATVCGGAALASFVLSQWIARGLRQVESAVIDHASASLVRVGIEEIDRAVSQVGGQAMRWDDVAANHRNQAQDFQSIMSMLDRRGSEEATSSQLRNMLAGIGVTLHNHLRQIEQGKQDIERYTKEIAEGAEAQGQAVAKTTTYVEQMSSQIDLVTNHAQVVQQAVANTSQAATAAAELIEKVCDGLERVSEQCHASESRIRGLADPTQQVTAIVETISDIAARTDMLALNASIESIRAGEHGRGFAVVADEVRKLAEQATQATHEITQLLESMRLATQDSIAAITSQRSDLAAESRIAGEAKRIVAQISQSRLDDQSRAKQIATSAHHQLQLAQDVVLAVEQISQVAKVSRGSAESACWTMRSLTKTSPQLDAVINRLCQCADPASITTNRDGRPSNMTSPTSRTALPPSAEGILAHRTTGAPSHLVDAV